jgi:hypothetical protein
MRSISRLCKRLARLSKAYWGPLAQPGWDGRLAWADAGEAKILEGVSTGDGVCIDKKSSAELKEAINSMYR